MTRTDVRGADPSTVRRAIEDREPLPGARRGYPPSLAGFSGGVDATLFRDVLGREPLFLERQPNWETSEADGPASRPETVDWAFEPAALEDPLLFPAGVTWSPDSDGEWSNRTQCWTLPTRSPDAAGAALERLQGTLAPALGIERDDGGPSGAAADSEDDIAVAFSGGIDSALVAAGYPEAPLYVVGFEGCHDVAAAREAADAMGRLGDLRVIELTHETLRSWVPRVVSATGRTNAMDVAIAIPLSIVAERAAADGYELLAVGQGADELFGGYAKVVDPADDHRVDAGTVRGAVRETIETLPDQLARDVPAIRAAGVDVVAPFLQDRVVDAALRLPGDLLVAGGTRKAALRRFAEETDDVPRSVWTAEKKALQYGTYVSRELDRLARQAGFKRRMDRHVDRYVESLVEDGR
ncbi:asparagine synthase (glutamine-hydrolysing) [Halalkaliarchaeum desulfuricum]|uniref:Asparagine synthase (Glutamine-hydrolysing) n=1 Tax=Halalkaliarchaeum desulfuricum TaxID=2055893 RepID=A0A343TG03_9EURY|nr:asparagine synthase-related protein [Halalkaliarchaeum desulfuricum]AUX08025.1 asparagine synthase (glutamine-hydrolysing) [Halalkaliarchaeum desulfuricum]